jgi:hypothetical protein
MQFWNQNRWRLGHVFGVMLAFFAQIITFIVALFSLEDILGCYFAESGSNCGYESTALIISILISALVGAAAGTILVALLAPRHFSRNQWGGLLAIGVVLFPLSNLLSLWMWLWMLIITPNNNDIIDVILTVLIFVLIPGIVFGLGMSLTGSPPSSAENPQAD